MKVRDTGVVIVCFSEIASQKMAGATLHSRDDKPGRCHFLPPLSSVTDLGELNSANKWRLKPLTPGLTPVHLTGASLLRHEIKLNITTVPQNTSTKPSLKTSVLIKKLNPARSLKERTGRRRNVQGFNQCRYKMSLTRI